LADTDVARSDAISQPSGIRFGVLAGLCLAATLAYIHRNSLGVVESQVRSELDLTKAEMGWVLSAFFVTYTLFQIPGGWLGQVWGTRRTLPAFALVWSTGTAFIGLATGVPLLVASRFTSGAAQAGVFACSTVSISKWFPETRLAGASGALTGFMQIGGAIGAALAGWLAERLGWASMFALLSIPGFAWAAWFWFWFRDRPEEHGSVNAAEMELIRGDPSDGPLSPERGEGWGDERTSLDLNGDSAPVVAQASRLCDTGGTPVPRANSNPHQETRALHPRPLSPCGGEESSAHAASPPWITICTHPTMVMICVQQFLRAAANMFYASWFATYLQETRDVSLSKAGVLTSLTWVGAAAGCLVGGGVCDWLQVRTGSRRASRQGLAVVSMVGCSGLILLSYPVENVWLAVMLISAGSFWSALAGPCAYTITIDVGGRHLASVFSVMNMAGNLGATLFPLVVPWLLHVSGDQAASWDLVLFVFAGIYATAGVCWLAINPNRTVCD
jgi:MFS family permease